MLILIYVSDSGGGGGGGGSATGTPERIGLGTSTITRFLKGVAARRSGRKYTYKKPHEGGQSSKFCSIFL